MSVAMVRRLIGDKEAPQHFTDAEISETLAIWTEEGEAPDLYGTAADLLTEWAAALTGAVDQETESVKLKRSQEGAAKLTLAATYRDRQSAVCRTIPLVRDDVAVVTCSL